MSKTVDEKVVEMRFDNAQFERNVTTSMGTLDKLKKALNFKDWYENYRWNWECYIKTCNFKRCI